MKLVIVTRGRENAQYTLKNIPMDWLDRTIVAAPVGERHLFPNVIREPAPMNIAEKRQWLLESGVVGTKFIMFDDDLNFSARGEPGRLRKATPVDISTAFHEIENALDTYPLIGLHARMMGQHTPPGFILNKRISNVQAVNTDLIGRIRVDTLPVLEDMLLNLSLITSGKNTAVYCNLLYDQVKGSNAPGGCSLHRTWEQQRDAVLALKEMFPDIVTVKMKKTKDGWWEGRERFDFVISWKTAEQIGKRAAK